MKNQSKYSFLIFFEIPHLAIEKPLFCVVQKQITELETNTVKKVKKLPIIGRKDCADFPDLRLKNIKVKVDTGAYTSSIHCHHIKVYKYKGKRKLKFFILDPDHPKFHEKQLVFEKFDQKLVKNSFGETELRFVINSTIKLFKKRIKLELSLTDRGSMRYPVLLGRKVLENRFLVDVSKTNLSYNYKMNGEQ